MHKDLLKLKNKKTNNPTKKWAKDLNRRLPKVTQVENKYVKKWPILVKMLQSLLREMQIKTTTRYHRLPARIAITNKSTNECWRGCGEEGTLIHCW